MNIVRCDACHKTIKKTSESVHIGVGGFFSNHIEICKNCAKPILDFLETKNLIENKK